MAALPFHLYAACLRNACSIEQEDRAAVVGQRGAGIDTGRHDRGRGRFDHQFLVVVDMIDRQGICFASHLSSYKNMLHTKPCK